MKYLRIKGSWRIDDAQTGRLAICRTISLMNFLIDKTDTPWRARPAGRTADPSDPATLDFKDH